MSSRLPHSPLQLVPVPGGPFPLHLFTGVLPSLRQITCDIVAECASTRSNGEGHSGHASVNGG